MAKDKAKHNKHIQLIKATLATKAKEVREIPGFDGDYFATSNGYIISLKRKKFLVMAP